MIGPNKIAGYLLASTALAAASMGMCLQAYAETITYSSGEVRSAPIDTNAGNVVLDASNSTIAVQSGPITGSNGIEKIGFGQLLLSGINTYTGETRVRGWGQLQLATPQALGSGSLSFADGGGILFLKGGELHLQSLTQADNAGTSIVSVMPNETLHLIADSGGFMGRVGAGHDSSLRFSGGGTIEIDAAAFVGENSLTAIYNSTLRLGRNSGFGTSTSRGRLYLYDSGRYDLNGNDGVTALVLDGAGTITNSAAETTSQVVVRSRGDFTGHIEDSAGRVELIKQGVGTLTLSGASTYSGGTDFRGGVIRIENANALGTGTVTMADATTLDFASGIELRNTVNLTGVAKFLVASGSAEHAGMIVEDGGAFGIHKTGAGKLIFSDVAAYTASTVVSAGTLSVNGSIASSSRVTVNAGATLAGTGSVSSTYLDSGATISPGNSIGTLTVAGDLSLAPGSTYLVEIAGNGASDRIVTSGLASVDGAKVEVTALDPETSYKNGQTYTILTAAGGVTGKFDPTVLSHSAFLDATVVEKPNTADLKIALKGSNPDGNPGGSPGGDPGGDPGGNPGGDPGGSPGGDPGGNPGGDPGGKLVFGTVADTFNRKQAAGALDSLEQSGPSLALYNKLLPLSANEARSAFDGLSGEVHASTVTGLIEDSRLIRDAINDRLRSAFETVGAAPLPLMGYGEAAEGNAALEATASIAPAGSATASASSGERYGAWSSAFGSWGSSDSDGNAAKLSRSTGGFVTGIDGLVTDDWRLGFLAGYSHSSFKVDDRRSSASSDNYHLGAYGGTQWGALSLRSGLAYTWSNIDSGRQVSLPGFTDSLSSSHRAGTTQIFGELGYGMKAGNVAFEPFANLAYVNVHTSGFTEKGGAAALAVRGGSNAVTFTTFGIRASTDFDLGAVKTTARGMFGWRHGFGDVTPTITQAFAGSSAFTIAGVPIARDSTALEAGLDVALTPTATLGISYQGQLAANARDHGVRADLNVSF
ncbi:autotransporter domain-containing protein [Rhizobiales bacterium 3FA27D7]|uniref:autotransporter family protein n=1 Tax=Mesorhizobium sp. 2RAF21 TaxID=3232995 RepID=UPI0014855501